MKAFAVPLYEFPNKDVDPCIVIVIASVLGMASLDTYN